MAIRITVDPKLLANTLASMKGEKYVTMRLSNNISPIVIDGEKTRAICLPVNERDDYKAMMDTIIACREFNHE